MRVNVWNARHPIGTHVESRHLEVKPGLRQGGPCGMTRAKTHSFKYQWNDIGCYTSSEEPLSHPERVRTDSAQDFVNMAQRGIHRGDVHVSDPEVFGADIDMETTSNHDTLISKGIRDTKLIARYELG